MKIIYELKLKEAVELLEELLEYAKHPEDDVRVKIIDIEAKK